MSKLYDHTFKSYFLATASKSVKAELVQSTRNYWQRRQISLETALPYTMIVQPFSSL